MQDKVWIVDEPYGGPGYAFDSEDMARWFQECRAVYAMTQGSQPLDGGHLFMNPEERDEVLKKEPDLARFIHQVYGSYEFINKVKRYCFWLVDASPVDIKHSRILYERVSKVKEFRLASKRGATQKAAERPSLFAEIRQPTTNYLLIPRVSSSRRQYVPMGYVSPDVIVTDSAFALPYATPYHFGILTSRVHMAWIRVVAGRLRNDYRYSNTLVYNNFVWPKSPPWHVQRIERAAQKILDVRASHSDSSFADMYDEVSMPQDLRRAHQENDSAVLEVYGLPENISDLDIVMHMFKLYDDAVKNIAGK